MTDIIYPFTDPQIYKKSIPVAEEYAYDLDTGQFKHENGKMYKVSKNEALKIKIWKLFMTERFRWVVFPWSYGHEFDTLIGQAYTQGYINSEAERFTKEAIQRALKDYIVSLKNLKIRFTSGLLTISFEAVTIYGRDTFDYKLRRGYGE